MPGGRRENADVETSLIESFAYPKYGPGQLWELTAAEVEKMGGKFVDSSTTKEHLCGKIMAFGRNNIVAYVSLMIWWMSFSDEYKCENKVLKIDYGKFKRGENDYIINSCNFKKEN